MLEEGGAAFWSLLAGPSSGGKGFSCSWASGGGAGFNFKFCTSIIVWCKIPCPLRISVCEVGCAASSAGHDDCLLPELISVNEATRAQGGWEDSETQFRDVKVQQV